MARAPDVAPRDRAAVPPHPGRLQGPGLRSHPHLVGPQLNPKQAERSVSSLWGRRRARAVLVDVGWQQGRTDGAPCLAHPGTGGPGSKSRRAGRLDSIPGEPHVKNRFSLKTICAHSAQVQREGTHSDSLALMV